MKTYQECVREYDDKVPHRFDAYMLGFLDVIAFIFNKNQSARTYKLSEVNAITKKRFL